MKPDKEGIWEWFDTDGTKRLVHVCNVIPSRKEPYLRVYWWGGYYNINDEINPCDPGGNNCAKQEWADRWGKYIGPAGSVKEEELYQMPTPEQRQEILNRYNAIKTTQ
jgi:hypothetical protein